MKDFFEGLIILIIAFGIMIGVYVGLKDLTKDQVPGLRAEEPYRLEKIAFPPVEEVLRCKHSSFKSSMSADCLVRQKGLKPKWFSVLGWPDQVIKEGDILVYTFKVNARTVELWNTKENHWKELYNGACLTKDRKCIWPSKNRCTKWGEEKGVKVCEEYPATDAVQFGFGEVDS